MAITAQGDEVHESFVSHVFVRSMVDLEWDISSLTAPTFPFILTGGVETSFQLPPMRALEVVVVRLEPKLSEMIGYDLE